MTKLETNALRIAELKGFIIKDDPKELEYLIAKFDDYNGLMPIVFECNAGILFGIIIRPDEVVLHEYGTAKYYYMCDYTTEPEFIEALQLAVIKYLELKNG